MGMGKDLYETSAEAKALFEKANEILGFRITDLMFEGTDERFIRKEDPSFLWKDLQESF